MKLTKLIQTALIGSALTCFSTTGFAATSWSLDCGSNGQRCPSDTEISSNDGITATVTAWGNSDTGSTYERRSLYNYSGGLGSGAAEGEGSPEHGFDNVGIHEFALIQYSTSVALEQIRLDYINTDADVSILAYTSANAFDVNTKLAGLTDTQLLGAGWDAITNIDISTTGSFVSINNGSNGSGVSSQYWLVGAYNSAFSSAGCIGTCQENSGYPDYFKLRKLKGTKTHTPPPPGVPVPGTAALLALGLLLMRRKTG